MAENNIWTLSKRELLAILAFASTDENRAISCVCFDQETGDVLATDGHMALCVGAEWRPLGSGSGYSPINRAALQAVAKAASTKDRITITIEGGQASITTGPVMTAAEVSEAKFPPVRQVFPTSMQAGGASIQAYNASYLARLEKITKATGMTGTHTVEFYASTEELGPALFIHRQVNEERIWSVLLMPIRMDAPTAKVAAQVA